MRCYRWAYANKDGTYRSANRRVLPSGGVEDVIWRLGEWVKHDGPLVLCKSGLHGCRDALDALDYSGYGDVFMVAEYRGRTVKESGGDTKFCTGEMRLIQPIPEGTIRRAALDFAEHVYGIWAKEYPEDPRVRVSLDATRAYLDDPTPENEVKMNEAAGAAWAAEAAWAAGAAGAAWVAGAAWAAEAAWAAQAAQAAGAAGAAGAAWVAGAAWAARAAERKWQRQHLKQLIEEALRGG